MLLLRKAHRCYNKIGLSHVINEKKNESQVYVCHFWHTAMIQVDIIVNTFFKHQHVKFSDNKKNQASLGKCFKSIKQNDQPKCFIAKRF